MRPFGKENNNQNILQLQSFFRKNLPFLQPNSCGEKAGSFITIPLAAHLSWKLIEAILNKCISQLSHLLKKRVRTKCTTPINVDLL